MKIMFDLTVLLDVVQRREPHFNASASVCAMAVRKDITGLIPAHAVTTIAYVVHRYAGARKKAEVLDWLLASFQVAPANQEDMLRARTYKLVDFEAAVVVSSAERNGCRLILSRNVADFGRSPVLAMTPEEFLAGDPKA